MPLNYGLREQTDPYYLYERQLPNHEVNLTPKCKFYACDYVDQNQSSKTLDGYGMNYQSTVTIKALIKPEISVEVDDIVYSIKSQEKWRILSITTQDDGTMKRNSLKPRQYLILSLVK